MCDKSAGMANYGQQPGFGMKTMYGMQPQSFGQPNPGVMSSINPSFVAPSGSNYGGMQSGSNQLGPDAVYGQPPPNMPTSNQLGPDAVYGPPDSQFTSNQPPPSPFANGGPTGNNQPLPSPYPLAGGQQMSPEDIAMWQQKQASMRQRGY